MYDTGYYATGYYQTGYYMRQPGGVDVLFRTYETLVNEAREMLGDDDPGCLRYPDTMILSILNRALQELQRIRPDAWYTFYDTGVPEVTFANWDEPFGPELRFYPAVLQYVVGMTEVSEDPYMESGSVDNHLQLFRTLVLRT